MSGLFSRYRNALLQFLPLQLLLGNWLLFSRWKRFLCVHVQCIVANKECYQQPAHNQQDNQSRVESCCFNILVHKLLLMSHDVGNRVQNEPSSSLIPFKLKRAEPSRAQSSTTSDAVRLGFTPLQAATRYIYNITTKMLQEKFLV
ncbi:hypothetical protein HanXRQr2_Chr13g0584461 [Helianthus annuus]|uniref:Uncharacterized protein n=1 Tax=Helianthus annuus TaxID=4232 RepID=A0A9K3EHN4_HELAN|nr:hypothetical protein HanXRQr2_Chr13g0584461 [Helianthus annuus]KAJ0848885.1 hypothetical protein HanPSC8_Chr13g0562651 [Helianthus annuus]